MRETGMNEHVGDELGGEEVVGCKIVQGSVLAQEVVDRADECHHQPYYYIDDQEVFSNSRHIPEHVCVSHCMMSLCNLI